MQIGQKKGCMSPCCTGCNKCVRVARMPGTHVSGASKRVNKRKTKFPVDVSRIRFEKRASSHFIANDGSHLICPICKNVQLTQLLPCNPPADRASCATPSKL